MENDKEELKIIATLAVQNNPIHQIHPEQSQIQPDKSQIQQDRSQIRPDKSQIQPDTSQIHPYKSQILPNNSQICSEQSQNSDYLRKQNGRQSCDYVISADLKDNIQLQKSITNEAKSNQSESRNRSHDQQSNQLEKSISTEAQSNQSESSNVSNDITDYKIQNLFGK